MPYHLRFTPGNNDWTLRISTPVGLILYDIQTSFTGL